jgi:hypothetical protein
MGEGIAKLVGVVFLIIAAIYAVVLIVAAAVVVAAVLAPPVGAGYWLRKLLNQRYQLGARKTLKCVLVGLAMAALPLLPLAVVAAPVSDWAVARAIWMSATGCLLGVGLYLSLSVYHDVFWPHRKAIILATKESLGLRYQLWRHEFRLNRVSARVGKVEQQESARLMEIRTLEQRVSEVVRSIDPAFLSAERVRWELEFSLLDETTLRRQLESVQSEMSRTEQSSPYYSSLVVQAGVLRLNVQKRAVAAGVGATYEADVTERVNLESVTSEFRQRLNAFEKQVSDAYSSLRQLRRQRLFVQ